MKQRVFGAVAFVALAGFAATTPGIAKSAPTLNWPWVRPAPRKNQAAQATRLRTSNRTKLPSTNTSIREIRGDRLIFGEYLLPAPDLEFLLAMRHTDGVASPPPSVMVTMRIRKIILRALDKQAELSVFVSIVMVLAIGILAKFDAAAPLSYRRH